MNCPTHGAHDDWLHRRDRNRFICRPCERARNAARRAAGIDRLAIEVRREERERLIPVPEVPRAAGRPLDWLTR